MDVSAFDSSNFDVFLSRCINNELRENKDPKKVLIRIFMGPEGGEQQTPLSVALDEVVKHYHNTMGIKIIYQTFTNDTVRNKYRWTCTQLFDALLAADIHIIPTHLHQGMMGLGGLEVNGTWNIPNILNNLNRLRYHLGSPCGMYIDDPVGTQNKIAYYNPLQTLGLCAPTISVDISKTEISLEDKSKIERLVYNVFE